MNRRKKKKQEQQTNRKNRRFQRTEAGDEAYGTKEPD